MSKWEAWLIIGGLTVTSKMPCKSYSLPTVACHTGFKMAKVKGSICSACYADKGNYVKYAAIIEPAQHARLASLQAAEWVDAMITCIGQDTLFRWHDSGDLQDLAHLHKIVLVAIGTPRCRHWLPTREYNLVKRYLADGHTIPHNLTIRLSAMFPDVPVTVPDSLTGVRGVTASNCHRHKPPVGLECNAPAQGGRCMDCRACWGSKTVSYRMH